MQWSRSRVVDKEEATDFLWVNSRDGKTYELQGKLATLQDVQAVLCTLGFLLKKTELCTLGFFLDKAEKTGHHRSLASHLMEGDGNAEGKFSFSEETVLHGSWHCNYKVFGLESAYCF